MFKLVDQLQHGIKQPVDISEPLQVALFDGKMYSLSNRRLAALMMYQALHRDVMVKASCIICNFDTEKFEQRYSTQNQGLGIGTNKADSEHFGHPLFQ